MVGKIENKSKVLRNLLALFFLVSPLDYVLPHFGSATILTVVGLGVSAVAFFFAFGHEVAKLTGDQICIMLIACFMVVSNLWAQDTARSYSYTFSFVATAAMYFLLFFFKFSKKEMEMFEFAYIIGGALFILYVFTQVDMSGVMAGYRLNLESVGNNEYFADPNGLAARLMIPLVLMIKQIVEKKDIKLRIALAAAVALIVYIIFLTGSRASVITLITILVVVFLKYGGKNAGTLIVLAGVIVMVVMMVPDILPEHIYNRIFSFSSYQDVTTQKGDRIDVWKNTIFNLFPKAPLWGHGAGNASVALAEYYGSTKSVHSTWFTTLGDLGAIGFVLWIAIPFGKIKQAFMLREKNIFALMALLSVLIMASTLDAVTEKYLWNGFLYVHLASSMFVSSESEAKEIKVKKVEN